MREAATIRDVASVAGVSVATVSRVLNGTAKVSASARDAVVAAIASTGFTANPQARALALGKTNTIGVLLTEPFDEFYDDPTYASVLRGINDELAQTPVLSLLMQAHTQQERQKVASYLQNRGVDALIHLSPYNDPDVLDSLSAANLPVVLCGGTLRSYASSVFADDVKGAKLAARHAVNRGALRIAAIVGDRDNPASIDRVRGYREVLGEDRLPESRIVFTGWSETDGYQKAVELLAADPSIDLILCGSDRIAVGAINALTSRGKSVPDDVAIIGFDDHKIASQVEPSLTTVMQPLMLEGQTAVQLALEALSGSQPRVAELEMELVVRQSA